MNPKRVKRISISSKAFQDIVCIPEWTKHHTGQENPLEGEPAEPLAVFYAYDRGEVTECYLELVRRVVVVKTKCGGKWYDAPLSELDKISLLREKEKITSKSAAAISQSIKRSQSIIKEHNNG